MGFDINEEWVLVHDWEDIAKAQSPEVVVDYNKNHPTREKFPHHSSTRNPTGYAGCEGDANGHVWLQKERPLMAGSIHYVMVSDPTNVLPPFGIEERFV